MYRNKNSKQGKKRVKREQPRKDDNVKRINLDNERVSKFVEDAIKSADKMNDVSWYAKNPELLKSAGSVSFSNLLSGALPFAISGESTTDYDKLSFQCVPYAMGINWSPAFGGENSDVLEAAKQGYYSFVVHANSRNESYTANDLMVATIAGSEVFGAIATTARAYGLLNAPSDAWNAGYPLGLVKLMGFDDLDFRSNLHDIWFTLNNWVSQTAQIWLPNTMPITKRWYWLNSNVYMDGDSPKAQYYMFVQEIYHVFSDTASDQGSSLVPLNRADVPNKAFIAHDVINGSQPALKWTYWKQMVQSMIDALIGSLDRGLMMGDILKAYGPDKIYALKEFPSNYTVAPVYNKEVLTQIENSVSSSGVPLGLVQDQSTGNLKTAWGSVRSFEIPVSSQTVLNFHQKEQPTPEQVMVATRLSINNETKIKVNSMSYNNTTNAWEFTTEVLRTIPLFCGSEIVTYYTVANASKVLQQSTGTLVQQRFTLHTLVQHHQVAIATSMANAAHRLELEQIARWTAFDWSPWLYVYDANNVPQETGQNGISRRVLGDFDMFAIISNEQLRQLHTTAIYSEFDIPTL